MKLTFNITFEDYYEYNKVYSKMAIGKRLCAIFNLGIVGAVIGTAILACCLLGILTDSKIFLLGGLFLVVGVYTILYPKVFFYSRLKKDVRRKHKSSDYFKNERTVEIFDDYIITSSENDDHYAPYKEELKEFIETKNLFVVMVRGRRGIIIPKRACDTDRLRRTLKAIGEAYDVRYRFIKG